MLDYLFTLALNGSSGVDMETGVNRLALINKGARPLSLLAGASDPIHGGRASIVRLEGPALDAKSGITLGGAEVTPEGAWKPTKAERIPVRNGRIKVELGPATAAIVQIEGI